MRTLVLSVKCCVNVRVPATLQCVLCLPTLESAAECIGGQGHGGRNLLVDGGERGCKGKGGERGDASFHFLPTSLLLTDIVLSKQQIVWPWASSVHFIANSASAENGFNLFCRFFLRRHQMHLIREGLEVNLIKVMGVTFLNTLAIADHVCKTKYWVGGWEHWWEG